MRRLALVAAAVALLAMPACQTTAPRPPRDVPDPLAPPPAGAAPTAEDRTAVYGALAAAARGDRGVAEDLLGRLGAVGPVARLTRIEVDFLLGSADLDAVATLAEEQPEWVPAWEMLATAAERVGAEDAVLRAARRLLALEPGRGREEAVERAERMLTDRALETSTADLESGDFTAALGTATAALELVPGAGSLRTVMARAYLGLGRLDDAAGLVPALPDSDEGLRTKGAVAAALGQWDLAASFYEQLPDSDGSRCRLLTEARRHTRLANAPPYIWDALASPEVVRHQLAALAVLEVPELTRLARGKAVLYEDVVQLADGSDVATVARTGLMTGDAVARRFHPDRKVTYSELRDVLDRLADLLGRTRLDWCDGERDDGCETRPDRLDGEAVDALIRRVAGKGEEGCSSP